MSTNWIFILQECSFHLIFGIQQGSVMRHIILTSYSSGDICRACVVDFEIFSDDDQLWISFTPNESRNVLSSGNEIEACMIDFNDWMLHNKHTNNGDKLEAMLVSS